MTTDARERETTAPAYGVWADLVGQEGAAETLRRAVAGESHAMSHAWLFTGPPGSGRSNAAIAFAAALQCEQGGCGECHACRTVLAGSDRVQGGRVLDVCTGTGRVATGVNARPQRPAGDTAAVRPVRVGWAGGTST